jgi:small subunit ribosomal protein S9
VAESKAKKAAAPKTSYLGTGRRKTSVARVRLTEGGGQILINGRTVEDYFTEDKDRNAVYAPLDATEMRNRLDVKIHCHGGGITGQAGAACHGIARALKQMFGLSSPQPAESADGEQPTMNTMALKLRENGYLTRDSRMKERKKYGRKGARKSFQFSKR